MNTKNVLQEIVRMNTENYITLEGIRSKLYEKLKERSDILPCLDTALNDTLNASKMLNKICKRIEEIQILLNIITEKTDTDADIVSCTNTKRKMKV